MQPIIIRRRRVGSLVLAVTLLTAGTVLAAWKHNRLTAERAATQPEPVEAVTVATATAREHRESTTAIGTVLALESITLRNELAGTVRHVSLTPGAIVEPGTVLVALDTSVEAADLRALVARLPDLRAVAFNGATAARIGRRQLAGLAGPGLVDLPSSSPAHAGMRYAEKLARWSVLARSL